MVNLLWLDFYVHKFYWELILYLSNGDLELYSDSFQFVLVAVILSSDQR
jgi:hypothetical protein